MAFLVDDILVNAYPHSAPADAPRDMQLRELGAFAHDMAELHAPDSIWIEDVIIGNNRKYSIGLAQTLGAVMSHLAHLRLGYGTDIRTVDNKVWKKVVVEHGNASKVEVKDYIDVTHSAYAPLCGDDQDLYDACCIGLYGREVMERSQHLQL